MALTLDGDNGVSGVNGSAGTPAIQGTDTNTGLTFGTDTVGVVTGGTTRTTVDSSGRLLVGTNSASSGEAQYSKFVVQGAGTDSAANAHISFLRGANLATSPVSAGVQIGLINFGDSAGNPFAFIQARTDGTTASDDYPGRLEFSTTADSASSPTERLRIAQSGAFGLSGANYGTSGQVLTSQGSGSAPQWATPATGANLVVGTQQSASGTSIELTSIPTNCQKIEIICYQVSWNTTASLRWQLGDFGGYENTGYFNQTMYWVNGTSNQSSTSTGSFGLNTWTGSGHGVNTVIRLYRRHTTGQNWNSECIADTTLSGTEMMIQAGTKDLSAGLDRVQLFPSNSASFDNGFIQFNYWTV